MIITCKNMETSVVTIKSFENFQISNEINKKCKSVPLKKELKRMLTANFVWWAGEKLVSRDTNLSSI